MVKLTVTALGTCLRCLSGRGSSLGSRPSMRTHTRLSSQRLMRCRPSAFPFQRVQGRARPLRIWFRLTMALTFLISAFSTLACLLRHGAFSRRRKFNTGPTRFRQANGDCLFCGASAVFALTNVAYLLANKFAGLSGRRLPFPLVLFNPFQCCSFWHYLFPFVNSSGSIVKSDANQESAFL
jgi:hypothetical protein